MAGQRATALDTWLQVHPDRAADVQKATRWELERLLGIGLAAPLGRDVDVPAFLIHLGKLIDDLDGPAAALGAFLAPRREQPGASLAEAMAEILFVPRSERTEYRDNTLVSPPWDIRRLLLEYALWSQRVDVVATGLSRGFCASSCDRLPTGCCSVLGYDMGLVPEAMLHAQQLEARLSGWRPPEREDKCKYHGPTGCCLRRFKSPACAGMLCDALVVDLRHRFDREPLEAFLALLARFRNQVLNRAEIFELMDSVVQAAEQLLDSSASRGAGCGALEA